MHCTAMRAALEMRTVGNTTVGSDLERTLFIYFSFLRRVSRKIYLQNGMRSVFSR